MIDAGIDLPLADAIIMNTETIECMHLYRTRMQKTEPHRIAVARGIFKKHGGMLRTGEAIRLGIHPEIIYRMRDEGMLEPMARGLFRLAQDADIGDPDLATIGARIPHGVICMVSALSFHQITTQVPHAIDIAMPRGARKPRIDYPPIRFHWFVPRVHSHGVEEHATLGRPIRVYSPERALVDCFRFRNQVGIDTCIEALRLYRERRPVKVDEIVACAKVCRANSIIRPYLEGIL